MAQLGCFSTAPHVEVRPTGTDAGVGIFAAKHFSLGESVITVDNPLIVALDAEKLGHTCYQCYRSAGDVPVEMTLGFTLCPLIRRETDAAEVSLSRCAGCKVVKYCGKSCQKLSWTSHHSLECPIYKAIQPQILPNHIRAILRFLLLRKTKRIASEDWDSFMTCPTHLNRHNRNDRQEERAKLKAMAKWIMRLGPFDVEEDTVLEMFMRLKINSLTLQTQFHDPLGLALHPLLAKVNHSCKPNCYVRCLDPSPQHMGTTGRNRGPIVLTPLRKIRAGEELTISYVEETTPVRYRKQELADRYFFTCTCSRCTQDEQNEAQLQAETKTEVRKVQDDARVILAMQNPTLSPGTRADILTSAIRDLFNHDPDWSLLNYPFPQLVHQLMLTHVDANDFTSAIRLSSLLRSRIGAVRYSSINPLRLVPDLVLTKLTAAILDALYPATTAVDTAAVRLSKEVDLEYWNCFVTKSLITEASKTWTEQPWPWLKAELQQRELQGYSTGSAIDAVREKKEKARMEELCDRVLDGLRHG